MATWIRIPPQSGRVVKAPPFVDNRGATATIVSRPARVVGTFCACILYHVTLADGVKESINELYTGIGQITLNGMIVAETHTKRTSSSNCCI